MFGLARTCSTLPVASLAVVGGCTAMRTAFRQASSASDGSASKHTGGETSEENIFSGPKDAMYASKVAHLLRKQVFNPEYETTKNQLTEKEEKLLRMWREMGNNPALKKQSTTSTEGSGASANSFSETGAMETQTTSWEGSGGMAAAAEGLKMQGAKEATGTTKKSDYEDEAPVNVAEAYGQTFRDIRPIDPKEKVEDKRRRLIYQSRYRGMVEMDLILGHFARCRLESLDAALLDEYDTLLKQLDNDLFRWVIMDMERPAEIEAMRCFHELRAFVEKEREQLLGNL